jgi:hypothetical protein
MKDEEYFGLPRLSPSGAKTLLKSPARYAYERDNPSEPSAELRFGKLVHCVCLEPNEVDVRYALAPDVDRRTTAGKETYARWLRDSAGKEPVSVEEWDRAHRMRNAVLREAGHMLTGGEAEKAYLWERDGVPLKSKLDYVGASIVDIKTTSAEDEEALQRAAWTYGYHISAAAYQEAVQAVEGRKLDKWFVFVTKQEPHQVVVLKASQEFIDRGRAKWDSAVRLYQACREFNHWPGLASRFESNELKPPRWA